MKEIAVIGAGAAGMFFAANLPEGARALIIEAANSPMKKLLLTGGGRCNFTNENIDIRPPEEFYPRGARHIRKNLKRFGARQAAEFFSLAGVEPRTEDEGKIFPASGDARDIADSLMRAAVERGAKIFCGTRAESIGVRGDGKFEITCATREGSKKFEADAVLLAVGGTWSAPLAESLKRLGHSFEPPAPSLFSLELKDGRGLSELSGLAQDDAEICAEAGGKRISARGGLLVTHFGLGGPAALKLSSFGAREFMDAGYKFDVAVNWIPFCREHLLREEFIRARAEAPKREIKNFPLFGLQKNLWKFIVADAGIPSEKTFANLSAAEEKKLTQNLRAQKFSVSGKSTHKEEFVTCGGIKNDEVDFNTMQSRIVKNLYFAGECLDIDAITGGFNLHAAWANAAACALNILKG